MQQFGGFHIVLAVGPTETGKSTSIKAAFSLWLIWKTLIPVQLLDNSNSVRDVQPQLWTAYRLSEHPSNEVHIGTCGVCSQVIREITPRRAELYNMLCMQGAGMTKAFVLHTPWDFSHFLHSLQSSSLQCWGGDTRDAYTISNNIRFLCCGADSHHRSSWLRNIPSVLLVSVTLYQVANFILTFVVLEIASLHEGKAEGMISDEEWEKTTLMSNLCSCFLYALLCWHPISGSTFWFDLFTMLSNSSLWLHFWQI